MCRAARSVLLHEPVADELCTLVAPGVGAMHIRQVPMFTFNGEHTHLWYLQSPCAPARARPLTGRQEEERARAYLVILHATQRLVSLRELSSILHVVQLRLSDHISPENLWEWGVWGPMRQACYSLQRLLVLARGLVYVADVVDLPWGLHEGRRGRGVTHADVDPAEWNIRDEQHM